MTADGRSAESRRERRQGNSTAQGKHNLAEITRAAKSPESDVLELDTTRHVEHNEFQNIAATLEELHGGLGVVAWKTLQNVPSCPNVENLAVSNAHIASVVVDVEGSFWKLRTGTISDRFREM